MVKTIWLRRGASWACVAAAAALWYQPRGGRLGEAAADAIRGGATCAIPGTQNCPAPASDCNTTGCQGTFDLLAANYGMTCPAGTTAEAYNATATFADTAWSNTDPGTRLGRALPAIDCIKEVNCSGCAYRPLAVPDVQCKVGTTIRTKSNRVPNEPDPNSGVCPPPP